LKLLATGIKDVSTPELKEQLDKKKPIRFPGWAFKFWLEIAVLEYKPEPEADRAWLLEELRQIKSLILNHRACRD